MTVNLPPQTGDDELDNWTYEVTQDINTEISTVVTVDPETGGPAIDGIFLGYSERYLDTAWGTSSTGANFSANIAGLPANSDPIFQGLRNTASTTESTNPAEFTWRQVAIPSGATLSTLKAWYKLIGGRNIDWLFQITEPSGYVEDTGQAVIDLDNISVFGIATRLDLAFAQGTAASPTDIQFATGRVSDNDYVQATPLSTSTLRAERTVSWTGTEPEVSTTASDYVFIQNVGDDGFRAANGFLFMASATNPPASPTGGVFSFTTGTFTTLPTGWTLTAPSSTTTGQQIFVSYWTAVETDASGAITIVYSTPVLAQLVVNDVKSVNYDGSTNPGANDRYTDTGATAGYFLHGSTGQLITTDVIARDFDVSSNNIRLGPDAGNPTVITGVNNTSAGMQAGEGLTTGTNNVLIGNNAGTKFATSTGSRVVAPLTGTRNTVVGVSAMGGIITTTPVTVSASDNTAIGNSALSSLTSGSNNSALGVLSGIFVTTGSDNVMLGTASGSTTTTGDQNILIGRLALASSATASNEIVIGAATSTVVNVGAYDLSTFGTASTYLELTDTPSAYGTAGQQVVINSTADGLVFNTPSVPTFLSLTDTPSAYGTAGQLTTVNSTADGLVFSDAPSGDRTFFGYADDLDNLIFPSTGGIGIDEVGTVASVPLTPTTIWPSSTPTVGGVNFSYASNGTVGTFTNNTGASVTFNSFTFRFAKERTSSAFISLVVTASGSGSSTSSLDNSGTSSTVLSVTTALVVPAGGTVTVGLTSTSNPSNATVLIDYISFSTGTTTFGTQGEPTNFSTTPLATSAFVGNIYATTRPTDNTTYTWHSFEDRFVDGSSLPTTAGATANLWMGVNNAGNPGVFGDASVTGGVANISIGAGAGASLISASNMVLIGENAGQNTELSSSCIGIGRQVFEGIAGSVDVLEAIAIGDKAGLLAAGQQSIAIGGSSTAAGLNSIAIGDGATASGTGAINIGASGINTAANTIQIGRNQVAVSIGNDTFNVSLWNIHQNTGGDLIITLKSDETKGMKLTSSGNLTITGTLTQSGTL